MPGWLKNIRISKRFSAEYWQKLQLGSSVLRKATLSATLTVAACASPVTPSAFVASLAPERIIGETSSLRGAITVAEQHSANPTDDRCIIGANLREALRRSLEIHTMLASGVGRLRLEACWTNVSTDGGFSGTTSEMRIHYRLLDADGQVRFDREINGSYRVALGDVPLARVRAAQSLQGAIRNNVEELLNALVAEDRQNPGAFAPVSASHDRARRTTSTGSPSHGAAPG